MTKEIVLTIFGSVGGMGVVLTGLFVWLGKIQSAKIIESFKSSQAAELAALNSKLDIKKAATIRNSDAQFELYSEVWNHLQDVKSIADRLWQDASRKNLEDFVSVLSNAWVSINRGRLILNADHYLRLKDIFEQFENYEVGKARLIELRRKDAMDEVYGNVSEMSVGEQIRENRQSKEAFESLLDEILSEFKNQLSLAA